MFGLAEQIRRHPAGIAAAVGEDQNLTGAGNHVDVHPAEDLALGSRDKDAAGADDFVHLGNRLRAVGQGCHRLGTAHAEDPGGPGDIGRGQGLGADGTVWPGRRDDIDFRHAGDPGRNHIH